MAVPKTYLSPGAVGPEALRPLEPGDIPQVAEIEREAFPEQWPPTPFRRELHNGLARYLVAWNPGVQLEESSPPIASPPHPEPLLRRLVRGVWDRLVSPPTIGPGTTDLITGYVCTWLMADEAHITAIAVRRQYRGRGIGELLLLGSLELALARRCRYTTLEVRPSNHVAQSLYEKYGFRHAGVRKRYYSDNREDAYIMTTPALLSQEYQDLFWRRKQEFQERFGETRRLLA